jgi:hypothetical protein
LSKGFAKIYKYRAKNYHNPHNDQNQILGLFIEKKQAKAFLIFGIMLKSLLNKNRQHPGKTIYTGLGCGTLIREICNS